MSDVEKIFSDDWCGMDVFLEKVLKPIFGDYEKGYHVFTDDREIKQKAREANIEEIKHCATFETIESNLKVYDVTVSDNIKIERNRVHIQSVIRLYIEQVEGALIVFHHKQVENKLWRFSYIEEIKNRKDSSSARRYTYIVGKSKPSRTIRERFDILKTKSGAISMHDLTNAFSVESLTKEFYNEIFGWYNWACEVASFPQGKGRKVTQTRDKNSISLIRLITRIMFVWFIKQKDLIPQWIFNEPELKKILCEFDSESETKSNYYNAILQNLFFATLNKEINLRSFTNDEDTNEHYGIKTFYRDDLKKSFFKISRDEVIKKFESVPFLNGGLFECLDKKDDDGSQDYQDGFSREQNRRAFLPNALFFAREKNGHEGLFHILNKYNFTIEENSPSEVQVALDPELLGNVFENLLGTYNPETSETARKDSGSFYTPREIVSFMVNEALKAHLSARLGADSQKVIDKLFDRNVTEEEFADFAKENKIDTKKIINALKEVKVFDPACGSGAFPTGILQELVSLIKKIDMDSCDTEEKLYELKLSLIENCIFGSDIQPIAIQIAKLRFFITLICEQEKTQDAKNNYGIKALPNLETKFVVADSLTGIQKPEPDTLGIDDAELSRQKDELWEIRKKHFKAATASEKHLYRERDEQKRKEIVDLLKKQTIRGNEETIANFEKEIKNLEKQIKNLPVEMVEEKIIHLDNSVQISTADNNAEKRKDLKKMLSSAEKNLEKEKNKRNSYDSTIILEKLLQWNPYEQNDAADFFDSEWMFGIKDGFDIVIGNPPYISTKGITEKAKEKYENEFGFSDDTYNLFTFKGLQLTKENGFVTYIIPKTFWTTQTKRNMRNFILSKNIKYIFDTANPFDAVMVDTCIILVENSDYSKANEIRFLDGCKDLKNPYEYKPIAQEKYLKTQNEVIFKPTELNLKIWNLYGEKVKELYSKWWEKIETSKKISQNETELKKYRESLKPGDIALLGCLTEGGQGLATANNGKYIAVRKSSKWAKNIMGSRPKKLAEAIKKNPKIAKELGNINPKTYLDSMSEKEIAKTFDALKEKYGRDIFGQGYIYKLIDDDEIADVEKLTKDEKENGISSKNKFYVPYDKGDKDGNRWYLETPFAIAWSKENVDFLKTNSGKKGAGMPVVRNLQFNFREGFCWTDINSTFLKARLKSKGVFDVVSMTLFTKTNLPDWYYVVLINTTFMSLYVDNFINTTSHFQINDARQTPIKIPTDNQLKTFKTIFDEAYKIKKQQFSSEISSEQAEKLLLSIQQKLDELVEKLYSIQ